MHPFLALNFTRIAGSVQNRFLYAIIASLLELLNYINIIFFMIFNVLKRLIVNYYLLYDIFSEVTHLSHHVH